MSLAILYIKVGWIFLSVFEKEIIVLCTDQFSLQRKIMWKVKSQGEYRYTRDRIQAYRCITRGMTYIN